MMESTRKAVILQCEVAWREVRPRVPVVVNTRPEHTPRPTWQEGRSGEGAGGRSRSMVRSKSKVRSRSIAQVQGRRKKDTGAHAGGLP